MAIVIEESAPTITDPEPGHRVDASTLPLLPLIVNRQSLLRHPGLLLCLITALGAFLRFVSLEQPALWGDEAFTYSRVCGSLRQLFDVLQFDGFMPLHYILYWWLGQHAELSPVMMRVPVALAGSLMPAAMYFLARQLGISPKTSLVTALFTACSAYMLAYSRDAKMYMPFWFFCAVHVGCLLWWMSRSGQGPAASGKDEVAQSAVWRRLVLTPYYSLLAPSTFRWLCWLAAGCAMIGYHALGLMIVGVEVLIFLTHRHLHWKRPPAA